MGGAVEGNEKTQQPEAKSGGGGKTAQGARPKRRGGKRASAESQKDYELCRRAEITIEPAELAPLTHRKGSIDDKKTWRVVPIGRVVPPAPQFGSWQEAEDYILKKAKEDSEEGRVWDEALREAQFHGAIGGTVPGSGDFGASPEDIRERITKIAIRRYNERAGHLREQEDEKTDRKH